MDHIVYMEPRSDCPHRLEFSRAFYDNRLAFGGSGVNHDGIGEIVDWCRATFARETWRTCTLFGQNVFFCPSIRGGPVFAFKNEDDLIHFRLRWG